MAFQDIIGHQMVIELFKRALVNQRVNHAYIFIGPEGVGKEMTALQFAKALNCLEMNDDSCGHCRSCRKFVSGNHPDFQIIQPEENSQTISIEQIRDLQKDVVYKPYESRWKIYLIPEAEKMTLEAANCLLKTLEEPPEYVVIILVTAQKDGLLSTLVSRCQLIQFSKLRRDEVRLFLEKKGFETNEKLDLTEIIAIAEGSIGQAEKLLEDDQMWDDRRLVLEFLAKLGQKTNLDIYEMIQRLNVGKNLAQWDKLFKIVKTFYRDLLILKSMTSHELIINQSCLPCLEQLKSQYSLEELVNVINLIDRTKNMIMANVDRELAFEVMLQQIKARRV